MKKLTWPNNAKFALDANFLVFASDPSSPYYEFCESILMEAESGKRHFCIADKTLYELYAVLENLAIHKRIGTIQEAKETFELYLTCGYFEILHSTNNTPLIVNQLLSNKQKIKKTYIHDIALTAMLIENGVDYLYTDNRKDFEEFPQITILDLEK